MRILLSTVSPASYMAPPRLSDDQITCGPECPDAFAPDGRVLSLQTPVGEYDIASVLQRLPADQQPDAVVCLVDATWRNQPRNLAAFPGPKALLIADTHHLQSPLIGMLQYVAGEVYDRIVFLYDRHHVDFFRSAGLDNIFWFPGLTFPHNDATVRAARKTRRAAQVAFVGQVGQYHPRRAHLIEAMKLCKVPLAIKQLSQKESLAHYGASLLGFNASLNGDLNLRAMEILASGAALITDRLSPESGLAQLWTDGRDVLAYSCADELVERIEHALAHPRETEAIGSAGAKWFDTHFHAQRRRDDFTALLVDGRQPEAFALPPRETTRIFLGGNTDHLLQTLMVYEGVQELHRKQEAVRVTIGASVAPDIAAMFATLPRVRVEQGEGEPGADIAIFGRDDAMTAVTSGAARAWCYDAQPEDFAPLADHLAESNFQLVSQDVAVFCQVPPTPPEATAIPATAPHLLVYTDDPSAGGVAQYNHSLMTALVRAGYRVTCVQTESDNPLVREQRALGIQHRWIGYDTRVEFMRMIKDTDDAQRLLGEDQPDFVVFSDCCPGSNIAARQVARMLKIPYLVVVGFVDDYLVDRFQAALPLIAAQYAAAQSVVAVSKQNLELLVNRFGLPPERGCLIYNGRPERFFAPRNEAIRAKLRAELGLTEADVLSLTTARLESVKGYDYQIDAAMALATRGALNVHFAWAGEGKHREHLEKRIAAAGLTGRIHLLGHRWDVADWYDAADIFLLPSDAEGMPLSIMEAMAKRLPVAASAVSGIPEQMGETGRLLPNGRTSRDALVQELAATLEQWGADAALRASLGTAARARADALFQEPQMLQRTLELIGRHMPIPAEASHATSK